MAVIAVKDFLIFIIRFFNQIAVTIVNPVFNQTARAFSFCKLTVFIILVEIFIAVSVFFPNDILFFIITSLFRGIITIKYFFQKIVSVIDLFDDAIVMS